MTLPLLGFGTGELHGENAENAVKLALKAGYRLIDTAANYGNEVAVGKAINDAAVDRKASIIMTKGAHDKTEHGYEAILGSFEISLKKLGLDYVDYYLVHWPSHVMLRRQTWRGMEHIYRSGKAKAIGVCNYAVHHLEEIRTADIQPAVNQIEFHPFIYNAQREILAYCKKRGIRVIGYATFADGQGNENPVVGAIARWHGKTPRQVLARWSIQHGVVPLVRSQKSVHIKQNYEIDFTLSKEDMTLLGTLKGRRIFDNPSDLP